MSSRRGRGSVAAAIAAAVAAVVAAAAPASPATEASATGTGADQLPFSIGTPQLAQITSGRTAPMQAPWNEFQGDPAFQPYPSTGAGTLYPTYTPGGVQTQTATGGGTVTEPNLAVFAGAASGTDGNFPYPTGTVGTPGTLDGYCGTGNQAMETAQGRYPVRQPADTTLPFSPAYFPHLVRNPHGILTGYFDWRPKDADEALVAATSSDNGRTWIYRGQALEENPGYCPSADTTDDGQGHANILTISGKSFLYTLPRAAGDSVGVGMIVHRIEPTPEQPLGDLPAVESVGIDPDAFVPGGTKPISVPTGSSGTTIPLTTLGTAHSPEQLVVGSFVDVTQNPVPASVPPVVMTCTALDAGANSLTGCSIPAGQSLTVQAGDLIEQVLGFAGAAVTVPGGPNKTTGDGGLSSLTVDPVATITSSTTPGFANPLTGTLFNNTVPLRLYANGTAIYCTQANANPTTKIEDCTAGSGNLQYPLSKGAPITGDPIVPATAYDAPTGSGMTNGLVAPDGIVGVLPSYPVTDRRQVPFGSTFVMYTEKELNYYTAANVPSAGTLPSSGTFDISAIPSPYIAADFAQSPTTSNGVVGPVQIWMGLTTAGTSPTSAIVQVSCDSVDETATTNTFTGCAVPSGYAGGSYAKNAWIGAPGASTVDINTLHAIGEGKSSDPEKLYGNNEDLTLLRVAWTTDGINFSSAGLANDGVISGQNTCGKSGPSPACASAARAGVTHPYDDISNPTTTTNPTNSGGAVNLNEYADNDAGNGTGPTTGGTGTGGAFDATEMRWVGSAGSIIQRDGIYELFLSGAWAADGDSDSFNHVFYSTSTDGQHWSVPIPVISTDYSFAASATQDKQLAEGQTAPLGISAYYSGRAYAPSLVPNPDGTLTMVFGADRIPKSLATAGTVLGTGSNPYTIGPTDPALYRNILVATLTPNGPPFDRPGEGPFFDTHHQSLASRPRP